MAETSKEQLQRWNACYVTSYSPLSSAPSYVAWEDYERLAREQAQAIDRLLPLGDEIKRLTAERYQWQERYNRERAAHAKNLTEQQKVEAERDRLLARPPVQAYLRLHAALKEAMEWNWLAEDAETSIPAAVWTQCEQALSGEPSAISAHETAALLTDWEKARDVVAAIVRQISGDMRVGALHCLHAIGDAMRGTPVSPVETTRPQAPIARLIVPDGVSGGAPLQVELYEPGLPPGEHDLYCEPEAVAPMMRAQEPEPEVCACGHHSRYHYEDGRGYIRCRATADCNCGWRIHEDAPVDPQAVPPVRPAQETPASVSPWTRPSESLPARNVPVLLAWNLGTGLMYDVGKYTGKRWLETIPQKKNQEFIAPDYWCLIPPVTGDHP